MYHDGVRDVEAGNKVSEAARVAMTLNTLVMRHLAGQDIVLGCWCVPEDCHANFIKYAIETIAERALQQWNSDLGISGLAAGH